MTKPSLKALIRKLAVFSTCSLVTSWAYANNSLETQPTGISKQSVCIALFLGTLRSNERSQRSRYQSVHAAEANAYLDSFIATNLVPTPEQKIKANIAEIMTDSESASPEEIETLAGRIGGIITWDELNADNLADNHEFKQKLNVANHLVGRVEIDHFMRELFGYLNFLKRATDLSPDKLQSLLEISGQIGLNLRSSAHLSIYELEYYAIQSWLAPQGRYAQLLASINPALTQQNKDLEAYANQLMQRASILKQEHPEMRSLEEIHKLIPQGQNDSKVSIGKVFNHQKIVHFWLQLFELEGTEKSVEGTPIVYDRPPDQAGAQTLNFSESLQQAKQNILLAQKLYREFFHRLTLPPATNDEAGINTLNTIFTKSDFFDQSGVSLYNFLGSLRANIENNSIQAGQWHYLGAENPLFAISAYHALQNHQMDNWLPTPEDYPRSILTPPIIEAQSEELQTSIDVLYYFDPVLNQPTLTVSFRAYNLEEKAGVQLLKDFTEGDLPYTLGPDISTIELPDNFDFLNDKDENATP